MAGQGPVFDSAVFDDEPKGLTIKDIKDKALTLGRRFLFGATPEETGAKEAGITQTQGPDLMEIPGARALAEKIRSVGRNTGNYWGGVAGSILGDVTDAASTGFDPRTAGIKHLPRIDPAKFQAELEASKAAYRQAGLNQGKPTLALPPATNPAISPVPSRPTFFNGPAGTADASRTYPMDTGPSVNPAAQNIRSAISSPTTSIAGVQQGAGTATVLPHELGSITQMPPIDAARMGTTLGRIAEVEPSLEGIRKAVDSGQAMALPKIPSTEEALPYDRTPSNTPNAEPKPSARSFNAREPKPEANTSPTVGPVFDDATTPTEPKVSPVSKVTDEIPKPGEARGSRDIGVVKSNLSVDRALESRPESKPIVDVITQANDKKLSWVATTQRQLADTIKGLNRDESHTMYDMLNGEKVDPKFFYLQPRVAEAKAILDGAWNMVPGATRGEGSSIGYLENYITHIEKDPDMKEALKQIMDFHKNPKGALASLIEKFKQPFIGKVATEGTAGDMYGTGLGNPSSPFAETRTGEGKNLQKDLQRVFPMYTESIAKLIFDKPAVNAAKDIISKLPETNIDGSPSKLRELSEWYVKNYTRYDSAPGLSKAWKSFGQTVQRTLSRSMLGLSPGLQSMHLARIPGNLLPELPTKYVMAGLGKVISSPSTVVPEAAKLGLLPNEIRPWAFKTLGEKTDTIIHFNSYIDAMDRLIGYHGFKQMLMESGVPEEQATIQALTKTKRTGLSVDPARPIKIYTPGKDAAGTYWNFVNQFHQVPTKIVEQYMDIAKKIAKSKDPAQAGRALVGIGSAIGLTYGLGIKAFHLKAGQFFPDFKGGPAGRELARIYNFLGKGDVEGALKETALILTPAGKSIEGQIRNEEPSLFENDNNQRLRLPTR